MSQNGTNFNGSKMKLIIPCHCLPHLNKLKSFPFHTETQAKGSIVHVTSNSMSESCCYYFQNIFWVQSSLFMPTAMTLSSGLHHFLPGPLQQPPNCSPCFYASLPLVLSFHSSYRSLLKTEIILCQSLVNLLECRPIYSLTIFSTECPVCAMPSILPTVMK